ncbi:MAG: BTAD domain-containing putative transcriptional regulator, partial [Microvirga sp.]
MRPGGEPIVAKRPPLAISLFDAFSAAHDGQPLAIKNKKAQAVVAYLLLAPGRRETRERLCGLLWSESSEEKARGSLRQALHQLRELFESIGFAGLIVGRDDISLRAPLFSVDVWAIEESAAETGDVHPLLLDRKRLPETLLCGLEELDPSFRLWLLVQRQALHERLARRLERALDAADREPSSQVDLATALLNLDPTHEGACRILMEDHAAHGDTAGALRVYKALWDLLDEEYDSEPSDQTKDLVVRIKTGEFKGKAPAESAESVLPEPSPGPSAPLSKALALGNVLPSEPAVPAHNLLIVSEFDSRGVGQEFAYLVHGLRHELISKLVRFRDWSVMDANPSAAAPRDDSLPVRYFAIDTTVREARGSLALTLTVKEHPCARYIWSDSYALDLDRWFEVQQAIIRRVALALNVHVSIERLMAAARRPDVSLGVFDDCAARICSWAGAPPTGTVRRRSSSRSSPRRRISPRPISGSSASRTRSTWSF